MEGRYLCGVAAVGVRIAPNRPLEEREENHVDEPVREVGGEEGSMDGGVGEAVPSGVSKMGCEAI